MDSFLDQITTEYTSNLKSFPIIRSKPLLVDKWIASSALQKSIRRGEESLATRAALTYLQTDPTSFWSRLPIIALEDIGIADPKLVLEVLAFSQSPSARHRLGERELSLFLVGKLCASIKSRLMDEVLILAERGRDLLKLRSNLANSGDAYLTDHILDRDRSLPERALALWYLAGTRRYRSDFLTYRPGNLDAAIKLMRKLRAPAEIKNVCIGHLTRSPYPLALIFPLLIDALHDRKTKSIKNSLPAMPQIEGVPLPALDMFTRLGKASIRSLQTDILELRKFSTAQIGHGVFYLEGAQTNCLLSSRYLDTLRQEGELADFFATGLDVEHTIGLKNILRKLLPDLQDQRTRLLQEYFDKQQQSFCFEEGL